MVCMCHAEVWTGRAQRENLMCDAESFFDVMLKYKALHCYVLMASLTSIWDSHILFQTDSCVTHTLRECFFLPICIAFCSFLSLHWSVSFFTQFGSTHLNSNFICWNSHQVSYLFCPKSLNCGFRNDNFRNVIYQMPHCDYDFLRRSLRKLFTRLRLQSRPSFFLIIVVSVIKLRLKTLWVVPG